MRAAIRPLGLIVAAAMVSERVPLVQEWLTWAGIAITGTPVGTRAQMRDLMAMPAASPFQREIERMTLGDVSGALQALHEGRAKGRYRFIYKT